MPHMDVLSDTADMHTSPKFLIKPIKPNAKHEFLTTVHGCVYKKGFRPLQNLC